MAMQVAATEGPMAGSRLFPVLLGLGAVCLLGALGLVEAGGRPISDFFHVGEAFAAFESEVGTLAHSDGNHLTIHGAADYLPAELAFRVLGRNNYFWGTVVAYRLANLAAALILYLLALLCAPSSNPGRWTAVAILAGLSAPVLTGYRDLLLLTSMVLFISAQREQTAVRRFAMEAGLGVTAAAGLIWSFDRGLIGVAVLGVAGLVAMRQRRYHMGALAAFAVTTGGLLLGGARWTLRDYVTNVAFLMETASQWSYGWTVAAVCWTGVAIAQCGIGLLALVRTRMRMAAPGVMMDPIAVLLAATSLAFLKIATNRADLNHVHFGTWAAGLTFLYGLHGCRNEPARDGVLRSLWRHASAGVRSVGLLPTAFLSLFTAVLIAPAAPPLAVAVNNYRLDLQKSFRAFVAAVRVPPTNDAISGEGPRWVASVLIASGAKCVLDLSNHGVINGLAGLPPCTRFGYPVYATAKYEEEMVRALKDQAPPVVVYSAEDWSFRIDGKSMHERLPHLRGYIQEAFPQEECRLGYCLRFAEPRGRRVQGACASGEVSFP